MRVPKERQPRRKCINVETGRLGRLDVGNSIGKSERNLLDCRRTSFTNVIAGNGNRVPARKVLRAVGEGVDNESHGLAGWVDVGSASDVFLQDVVLNRSANLWTWHTLLFRNELVHEEKRRGSRVDRHRGRHRVEREAAEKNSHVLQRVDGDTNLADFTFGARMVRVVAHLRREVEGATEARLSRTEQELEALIG